MFDGFVEFDIVVSGVSVHGRRGGSGPPLLLLHGIPETHLMWHRVAPALAERFSVVVTDLRGYGDSGSPSSTADHSPYAMRAVAADQVRVMAALGHPRFAVVGHDRGARCGYRMAIDHPEVVTALAVLDIVPTAEVFRRADRDFCLGYWVWSFLAAPYPVPEQLIAGAPATLVDHMLDSWSASSASFPPEVRERYIETFSDPVAVHAICEQYRAAATLDVAHDEADRGRHRLRCPVLALWSEGGPVDSWYEPLEVWREWADDVRGAAVPGGHFLPEESPEAVIVALTDFLS
ncbi:alpha/beta fold hydrolase [Pseudonocardia spinosispora]|uniref:alpha/beta fold hydrolase n=1 Tax=Pseudonocardia spinosispora TaxID=103441 RepID=UPI0004169395|nr:alpha/beta hydrolase [Pseudonocardia spinosispora]